VNPQHSVYQASFAAWQAGTTRAGACPSPDRRPVDDGEAVRALFQRAHTFALQGRHDHARQACAAAVLHYQPLLAASGDKLRAAFAALIVARGFRLLSRLARATTGQTIHVALSDGASLPAPLYRRQDAAGVVTYTLDSEHLACLSVGHDLVQRWSADLASGAGGDADFDTEDAPRPRLAFA
jgi:hypothetical protein